MKMNSFLHPGGEMIIVFASLFVCLYLHELKNLFSMLLQNALARGGKERKKVL